MSDPDLGASEQAGRRGRLDALALMEAARRGQSLNKTVLALLAERLGSSTSERERYDDLDELAGTWSKPEAARFDEAFRAQRQVDAKLWR